MLMVYHSSSVNQGEVQLFNGSDKLIVNGIDDNSGGRH
jgi:hypothetical protein